MRLQPLFSLIVSVQGDLRNDMFPMNADKFKLKQSWTKFKCSFRKLNVPFCEDRFTKENEHIFLQEKSMHIVIYVKHMQQTSHDPRTLQSRETLRNGLENWGYVPFNSHLKFRPFPPPNVSPTHTWHPCTIAQSESISFKYSHTCTASIRACTQAWSQSAYLLKSVLNWPAP